MNEARGASNSKAKGEFGWQPRYASWREGFPKGLADGLIDAIAPSEAELVRLPIELLAKIRVSDRDQGLGPLVDAQTEKVDFAVFGHDVVHVATARDDPGARREDRYNTAYGAAFGRAREHDDRASAPAARGTANEVDLPANARV